MRRVLAGVIFCHLLLCATTDAVQLAAVRVGMGSPYLLRYSPDGKWLAASTPEGIELYNAFSHKRVGVILQGTEAKTLNFSPDSALMAIVLPDNTVQIWSTETQQPLGSVPPPEREVVAVWFASKAGETSPLLYVGLNDGSVLRWRADDLQPLKPIGGSHSNVRMIEFSPSGQHFVALYNDNTISFWHFTIRRQLWMKRLDRLDVVFIWFSPSGEQLAISLNDSTIEIWDAATGESQTRLVGHSDWVTAFAFNATGDTGVSGSPDQTLRVWDITSGRELSVFENHTPPIAVLAYRPDGKQFASGTSAPNLGFWEETQTPTFVSHEPNTSRGRKSIGESANPRIKEKPVPARSAMSNRERPIRNRKKPTIVAHPSPPYTIPVGESLKIEIRTDSPSSEALTVRHDRLPDHAVFDSARSLFLWTPDANQVGETEVVFTVSAPDGGTASLTLSIDVQSVNVPPRIVRIGSLDITGDEVPTFEVQEGQSLDLSIEAQDANGDVLTYTAIGLPENAELHQRRIHWTPGLNTVSAEAAQAEFVVDLWASDGALKAALPIHIIVHHIDPTVSVQVIPAKSQLIADGQSTTDVTVFLTDSSNNPVLDELVHLSTNVGEIDSPARALKDGTYQSVYTAGTTPGTAMLRAKTSSGVIGETQIVLELASQIADGDSGKPSLDDMILIPAGEFEMRVDASPLDKRPTGTTYVEAFYIDRFEVTNAEYAHFLTAVGATVDTAGHAMIELDLSHVHIRVSADGYQPNPGYESHPVVRVNWYGAKTYARWAGKRLLTGREWEWAARGGDGRIYPWGSESPLPNLLNYKRAHDGPVSVGSHPQGVSPFGVHDMAGNVAEWVMDGRDASSASKVVRGGAWTSLHPMSVRSTERFMLSPDQMTSWIGFRCGADAR
ncbi:MAG: SUMF1/EgtB/PvdO family nonheme iron enzyme [Candidatus Poribacteria bacterium]|nr:SUMF1/EgtB/PvdO family nonheme iron enzyme [Candidatus Poribacteria bacterium]